MPDDNRHCESTRHTPDAKTVIVFTHGIMGSPVQFADLAEMLDQRYSYDNLLLPGHGKRFKDYAQSRMSQWQGYVDERVMALAARYDNIILVGHSMGGLLSIQTTLSQPDKIRGLFLLALPLKIRIRLFFITRGLRILLQPNSLDPRIIAAKTASSIPIGSWLDQIWGIPRVIELLVKSRGIRKRVNGVLLPLEVLLSRHDEIVSVNSAGCLKSLTNAEVTMLEDSGHYDYSPEDRVKVQNEFLQFVEKVLPK